METENKVLSGVLVGLGALVLIPLVIIVMSVYNGIFLKLIYNMFIPALYGLPELNLLQAIVASYAVLL